MGKSLTRASVAKPVLEWHLQAAQVKALRRAQQAGWPIRVEGDMNSGRRTLKEAGIAAATGINPGAADLRVFLPMGKLLMAENKTGKGRLSDEQVEAHAEFTALGHDLIVIRSDDPDDAADQLMQAVSSRLGLPIPAWTPPKMVDNR
ncbi:VRR-NUC domain-containing protein [Bosea sp. NPDC055332]